MCYDSESGICKVEISEPLLLATHQHPYAIPSCDMQLFLGVSRTWQKDLLWCSDYSYGCLAQSSEIRVLTEFHAYPKNRFICKTRTGRPLVSAIRFWNLRLLKSHWSCMATKSRLIQVGLVCESPKAQQINQRFTVDRRIQEISRSSECSFATVDFLQGVWLHGSIRRSVARSFASRGGTTSYGGGFAKEKELHPMRGCAPR
jgi:hypothetical protein